MDQISRREALRRAAWVMGGALSAPTVAGILDGCTPRPELTWEPSFFTERQARLVMQIAEGILPETDTPGANSLGVPGFIEEMVGLCFEEEARENFMKGLQAFGEECRQVMGADFVELDAAGQSEFLQKKNQEIRGMWFGRYQEDRPFFRMVKELTLIGYYTTEYGATQALQYQAIPVEYKGCISLEEAGNGKTWAT